MASPCELITSGADKRDSGKAAAIAAKEVWRIQDKYSRFDSRSTLSHINQRAGHPTRVDGETARLLNTAEHLYQMSKGRFDISSGVLQKAWTFSGNTGVPSAEAVNRLMPAIGWKKIRWEEPTLLLREGMQIDFGGFGKEYAADAAMTKTKAVVDFPVLINLGGDICTSAPRRNGHAWVIAIENPHTPGVASTRIELHSGAVATSGSTYRHVLADGKIYSHILDPITGWPVEEAPLSVTVAAPTCSEAGMWATLAMLQGALAEQYLATESTRRHWVKR